MKIRWGAVFAAVGVLALTGCSAAVAEVPDEWNGYDTQDEWFLAGVADVRGEHADADLIHSAKFTCETITAVGRADGIRAVLRFDDESDWNNDLILSAAREVYCPEAV